MKKRIGFSLDSDSQPSSDQDGGGGGFLEDAIGVSLARTCSVLSLLFASEGPAGSAEFLTTVDIMCKVEDMVPVSKSALYKAMESLGFSIKLIGGYPHWMVFPLYQVDGD